MTTPTSLYVDNSMLSAVQCSTQVALRNIYGYTSREERADLKCGSAAHKALATWFTSGDVDKSIQVFSKEYQQWSEENVAPDDARSWSNSSLVMFDWFNSTGKELIKDVQLMGAEFVECGFAYPLDLNHDERTFKGQPKPPEFIFCGRFDMLVRWKGQIYVWENKTTGSVNYMKDRLRSGSQMVGYLWAARQMVKRYEAFKEVKISGVIVNAIHMKTVPSSDRRCSKHGVKYSECGLMHLEHAFLGPFGYVPEMVLEWQKTALNLAKRYREILRDYPSIKSLPLLRTQGKFFGACPNCTFHDFCMAGKPLDMVETMLNYEPWSPFENVVQESQNVFTAEQARAKITKLKTA